MYVFAITPQIERDTAWLEAAHARLGRGGVVSRRWAGRLRRDLRAEAIAASSRMEGVSVDVEQTRRILSGDRPAGVSETDAALVEGYRDALAFGLSEVARVDFAWSRNLVLAVHAIAMRAATNADPGSFRTGPVFVTDGSGGVIYSAPMAPLVSELVDEACSWLNAHSEVPAPILAAMLHAAIAGIHPFRDGNGRTARILATLAMSRGGYSQPEFTSLEEWWGAHPRSYYGALTCLGAEWKPDANATRFVAAHVRGQRRQVAALAGRLAVERNVWTAVEDIVGEDLGLRPRATEALFDAFHGRTVTNRYYRGVTGAAVATATNDLAALQAAGLLSAVGEGRARSYTGTFRLIALVASAAGVPVLAEADSSIGDQAAVVLEGLRRHIPRG